jgi:hypothetical protein
LVGREDFIWFIGVVEDRNDPLQIGRLRVRIYNLHSTDKSLLPTENLMWASIQQDITSSALRGVGRSPTGIQVGCTVFGFMADSSESQIPILVGTLAGKDDVPPLAQGINTIRDNIIPGSNEPKSSYATKYPYNQVNVTEGGIIIEHDSTPNNVRIRNYHPSGSYQEISNQGQVVNKCSENRFDITVKDNNIFIGGNMTINVIGDAVIEVSKNCAIGVKGDVIAEVFGNLAADVKGDTNLSTGGNLNQTVTGNYNLNVTGTMNVQGTTKIALTAPIVSINGS